MVFAINGLSPSARAAQGVSPNAATAGVTLQETTQAANGQIFRALFLRLPLLIPGVIAAYNIVGEKPSARLPLKRILVAYATMAGSTVEVARAVGDEIAKSAVQVDVLPLSEVKGLEAYDGVVVGGPMIMGWHRAALGFLKQHRAAFQRIPLAVFVMAIG